MTYNITMLFICLCIIVSFGVLEATDKCSKNVSVKDNSGWVFFVSNGMIEWFCCDNHEDKNGSCEECSNGFTSDRGEPCYPCSNGLFGYKCGGTCSCTEYQSCDHVYGCLETTLSNRHTGVVTPTLGTEITLQPNSAEPRDASGLSSGIMIYSICVGGLLFVTSFSLFILWRKRQNMNRERHPISSNMQHRVFYDVREEGIYETINERNMLDLENP